MVEQLLPFLFIKKKQARLLLKLGRLKRENGQKPLSVLAVKKRYKLAKRCKELNKRGR